MLRFVVDHRHGLAYASANDSPVWGPGFLGGVPMLTVLGNPRRFCDGVTRRQALTVGALSVLGGCFNLPSLLAMEERRPPGARPGKARSVLLLYLHGGAPTQDMFDLKPAAPAEIR